LSCASNGLDDGEDSGLGALRGPYSIYLLLFYVHLQAVFGELCGGLTIETSAGYSRSLLLPESPIVNCLGKYLAQEIAVFVFIFARV
jgi:hypothetical protein